MRKYFIYLLALFAIVACSEIEEYGNDDGRSGNLEFGTSTAFLKLKDDSTRIAGMLEITAKTPRVTLEWDVKPGFNLDTTVTELTLKNGRVQLPIKWISKLEGGTYGSTSSAYLAGVCIRAGEDSKYVPLIWADEVDSVKIMEGVNLRTRAGGLVALADEGITITSPNPLELDKDTCGQIKFNFVQTGNCEILYDDILELPEFDTFHLDFGGLPASFDASPAAAQLLWSNAGAPEISFLGHVKINSVFGFAKFAYFSYTPPVAKEWEFIESIPDTTLSLPATGATVVAIANTNRKWSLKYRKEDGTELVAKSTGKVSGEQSLLIRIPDNTGTTSKNILVDVLSEDTVKLTLRYTQVAANGTFSVVNVSPETTQMLKAEGEKIHVTVNSDVAWWISYGGTPYNFPAGQPATGFVEIPKNGGSTELQVIVTVGYGEILAGTYVYKQNFGNELHYDGSNLPGLIPVDGATYTFNFSGSYVGNLQVRALLNDATNTVIVTSPVTSGKEVNMTIPNNYASLATRALKFQYKKGADAWQDMEETPGTVDTAEQAAADIVPQVLPSTDIPREGGSTSGVFSGTYRGAVRMKAVSGLTEEEGAGTCPGTVTVVIPALTGSSDRIFTYSYSVDGGTTWINMGTRTQTAGTLIVGSITPNDNKIPAEGKAYSCSFSGTYPGELQFRAQYGTLYTPVQKGIAPVTMTVQIPANTDTGERNVVFQYSKDGGTTWIEITTKVQTSNIGIGGGGNNTGDWEDKGTINGGGER